MREFRADPVALGLAGHAHWQVQHTPLVVAGKLHAVQVAGSYTVGDFQASGAARPGWCGRLLDWAKENLCGRRY
jgi:hypothetical protein